MRLTILSPNLIGEKLAINIYSSNRVLLAKSGAKINQALFKRLTELYINTVYIEDENTDIIVENVLSPIIKMELIVQLSQVFTNLKKSRFNVSEVEDIASILIDGLNLSENAMFIKSVGHIDDISSLSMHSIDVAITSIMIATKLSYNYQKMKQLVVGALLHDIGKIIDGDEVYSKKGYDFLGNYRQMSSLSKIAVLQQTENFDGSGKPLGIYGDKIHINGKILAVANDYIEKLQGEAILPHEILEYLSAYTFLRYDEVVLKAFKKAVFIYPNGVLVTLNKKLSGIVISQNIEFPERPIIKVKHNNKEARLDLVENKTLYVSSVNI